jgi:septal ring factor EnvC (AmiA/AmiB activator)
MNVEVILAALVGAVGAVFAASIPAYFAWRSTMKKARTSAPVDHFNAVIAGWVALHGASVKQFEEQLDGVRAELSEVYKQLDECKQRDTEKGRRIEQLEARIGPEADNR